MFTRAYIVYDQTIDQCVVARTGVLRVVEGAKQAIFVLLESHVTISINSLKSEKFYKCHFRIIALSNRQ